MDAFAEKLKSHSEHVLDMGSFCTTEETTKQALIVPFLDILGFTPYDPRKVKAEYYADFPGVKVNERVDYALFCHDVPVMFIEAKSFSEKIDNHCPQLSRYFNSTPEVTISAITNGIEWRFFTDLKQKNIMDQKPFLSIKIDNISTSDIQQLFRFRYDKFKPEALRTLAEESVFLNSFTKSISSSLRDVDTDFVRYVASRSNVERQLNQRFLDSITPLVKQAVEKSVSAMVVSGLTKQIINDGTDDQVTTKETNDDSEAQQTLSINDAILNKTLAIIGTDIDLQPKENDSYFSLLLDGKNNRWLIRYFDKKQPYITLPIDIDNVLANEIQRARLEHDEKRIFIQSPDDLLKISGLILDSYDYVRNDDNFRRVTKSTDSD